MNTYNPFDPKFWAMGNPQPVDFNNPRTAAVMGLASGLLQGGGWSPAPVSFGQALGAGLGRGVQSYREAIREKRLADAQQIQEGLQQAQIAKLQREAQPGGWLAGSGATAQMLNTIEDVNYRLSQGQPVSRREYDRAQIAQQQLAQPRSQFDAASGQMITVQPQKINLLPFSAEVQPVEVAGIDTPSGVTTVTTGPGGESITRTRVSKPKLGQEEAKATVNARAALKDIGIARDKLFTDGELNRWAAGTGMVGAPGSEGRVGYQAMRRAVEVLLRMRTGAAAPATEVDTYMELYAPSPLDSDEGANIKMESLEDLFNTTLEIYDRSGFDWQGGQESGEFPPPPGIPQTREAGTTQAEPVRRRYNPDTGRIE